MLLFFIDIGGAQQIDLSPLERSNGRGARRQILYDDLDTQQMTQHADNIGGDAFVSIGTQGDIHRRIVGHGYPEHQPATISQPQPIFRMQRQGLLLKVLAVIARIDMQKGRRQFMRRSA